MTDVTIILNFSSLQEVMKEILKQRIIIIQVVIMRDQDKRSSLNETIVKVKSK